MDNHCVLLLEFLRSCVIIIIVPRSFYDEDYVYCFSSQDVAQCFAFDVYLFSGTSGLFFVSAL